ncbi:NADH dehydrogenase [ubiquinone] iron-sulfur protein 5-like [Argiope bruennichi]|uniref:NADH dehydrogenase [ubiquinone] iron-sulfur protein 5-like n=1 Tax=Argiope bruennichi TaxID=94029 RepID=UPI0024940E86|nr:NADH dehydrogenase [ubiquinone] iron-sulfur protein 5-like [Argiope bruennichi]
MTCVNDYYSYFHSPFADYLGLFAHSQHIHRCRELELNVLDCTDVYGRKGLKKQCATEYEDFLECLYNKKQHARVAAMQQERLRQYYSGERTKKNLYSESPKLDGFHKTYTESID